MSEKLPTEERHSRWAETVLKAVADALEGKPVSDFMESFAVVRRAAELHEAEARSQQLAQENKALRDGILEILVLLVVVLFPVAVRGVASIDKALGRRQEDNDADHRNV